MDDIKWSRFAAGLFGYISDGRSRLVKTDYELNLNMSDSSILQELQDCNSVEQLSPEMQRIAEEYLKRTNRPSPDRKNG